MNWRAIGAVEARTDRFDIAEDSCGDDWHFRWRVHLDDAPACDRAANKAQYAGASSQIGGVAAAAS